MDDCQQATDALYTRYKRMVKLWEKDFIAKHDRRPSKHDIREAKPAIKNAYKMYYKLKTNFLENTLSEAIVEDGFDIDEITEYGKELERNDQQNNVNNSISNVIQLPSMETITSLLKAESFNQQECRDFEAAEDLPSNHLAWNNNVLKNDRNHILNKTDKTANNNNQLKFKKASSKLAQSSLTMRRNPRKSLNRIPSSILNTPNISFSSSNSLNDNEHCLSDLGSLLTSKILNNENDLMITNDLLLKASDSKHHTNNEEVSKKGSINVDINWLERNSENYKGFKSTNGSQDTKLPSNSSSIDRTQNITYSFSNRDNFKLQSETTIPCLQTNENNNIITEKNLLKTIISSTHDSTNSSNDVSNEDLTTITAKRRKLNENICVKDNSDNALLVHNNSYEDNMHTTNVENILSNSQTSDIINTSLTDKPNKTKLRKNTTTKHSEKINNNTTTTKKKTIKSKKNSNVNRVKKESVTNSRTTRSTKKRLSDTTTTSNEQEKNNSDLETDIKPPDPMALKYSLTLECDSVTTAPRVKTNEFNVANQVIENYINSNNVEKQEIVKDPAKVLIDYNVEKKRLKLEEKIKSGKLNDNYVCIDLRKKVFVRGKKPINFSRYKKKQWHNRKKIAALSGPNMDMKGCDGGTLKCFKCGEAGHFAQRCPQKGDSLLPLTALIEDDISPYPSLEEAENMASQSAKLIHSGDISKLPSVANTLIYRDVDTIETNNKSDIDDENNDMDVMDTSQNENAICITNESNQNKSIKNEYVGHCIPDSFLKAVGFDKNEIIQSHGVKPLYDLNPDGTVKNVTSDVMDALRLFGHSSFRKGQDRAIMRILSGLSTLVTLSTGSGKSLCYQLPAYLYARQKGCITLVISPLVSLMEDQVTGVPNFLRAHCLHTNQTPEQKAKILNLISNGQLDILLVSPEAVVSGERSKGFGTVFRQLPPIAFACIDEAHCVSQWSHNFRPSYLMICKILQNNLGIKCILGLTATATLTTRSSIICHLGIKDNENGVISDTPLPDNLILSVSKDENRDLALYELLTSERFKACNSIIVYCTRRDECERVAGYLRTSLQDQQATRPNQKRKRVNWYAEPYHAGLTASRRRTIQNAFMSNDLRIVVATIAFGMGINKPDIRAIIHYNMPHSFESYVQEVGRSGRDNKTSYCHLFLETHGKDQNELRRHIHANSMDRNMIRKLIQLVFVPCSCGKIKTSRSSTTSTIPEMHNKILSAQENNDENKICPGHEVGFSIEKAVSDMDIPEENIYTLLCYMELMNRWNIKLLSNAYIKAKVISYGGPKYLKHAAKECPPLALAIAMAIKDNTFSEEDNIIEFSVIDVASAIGWNSGVVKHQLKNLEWVKVNGLPKRSPISVIFSDLGFRLKVPGNFDASEIDNALNGLHDRVVLQESKQLMQLQYIFQNLRSVAKDTWKLTISENCLEQSDNLKKIIRHYFLRDYSVDLKLEEPETIDENCKQDIVSAVQRLLSMYPENNFSGRNVAKIFHGISSPNYPAVMWHRCKYWRSYSNIDFKQIVRLANNVLVGRYT